MSVFPLTALTIVILFFGAVWLARRLQPEDDDERQR